MHSQPHHLPHIPPNQIAARVFLPLTSPRIAHSHISSLTYQPTFKPHTVKPRTCGWLAGCVLRLEKVQVRAKDGRPLEPVHLTRCVVFENPVDTIDAEDEMGGSPLLLLYESRQSRESESTPLTVNVFNS